MSISEAETYSSYRDQRDSRSVAFNTGSHWAAHAQYMAYRSCAFVWETNLIKENQNGNYSSVSGVFGFDGAQLEVEFQAPMGATVAEKDAAFMAALAQKANIDYLVVGERAQPDVADNLHA